MDLHTYARERDALLQRTAKTLNADERVRAAWLSGSFGRGEADEWSDLDLHVAVADDHLERFLAERDSLYRQAGRPLLVLEEMASDSQPGARFQLVVYEGLVEVDWNIGPAGQARRPLAFSMLVEREEIPVTAPPPLALEERRQRAQHWLTFFWAMAPIAIKLCGRGDTERAANQVRLLTTAFIALWRITAEPDGREPIVHSLNRPIEPELDTAIPRLGSAIDPAATLHVVNELCQKVIDLQPALARMNVEIDLALPVQVAALRDMALEVLQRGPLPRRIYR